LRPWKAFTNDQLAGLLMGMAACCPTSADNHPANGPVTELFVTGMNCQGCVRSVGQALQAVPGVERADVSLEAKNARVRWQDGAHRDVSSLVQAVEKAGFAAKLVDHANHETKKGNDWSPLEGWRFNVVIGLIVTIPLLAGDWLFRLGNERWFQWLAFALALPVQIFCGARFYRGAWNQI
jgi:Cu+-exporting ATPase